MNIEVDSERGSLAKILTIFFFRTQGFVNVLDACHKCGSGRDRTPIMHKHSGNKRYIFADDKLSRWTPSKGATQKLSQSSFSGRRALFNAHVLDACHECGSGFFSACMDLFKFKTVLSY